MAELTKWDPAAIKKKIADHIKASYVDLIPPEAWTQLVESEVAEFTTDRREEVLWNGHQRSGEFKTIPSPLKQIVREELTEFFKGHVKAELSKAEYAQVWDNTRRAFDGGNSNWGPGEAVKEIVRKLIPDMIESVFGSVVQNAIQTLKNRGY